MTRTRLTDGPVWRKRGAWAGAAVVLLALFPPFHIRPRGAVAASQVASNALDVPAFALRFWNQNLLAPVVRPVEAAPLVAALVRDPAAAAQQYGRRTGIRGRVFFLVSGTGRIESIDQIGAWIAVGPDDAPRIVLLTGPVFGNALRDATGALNLSDYSSFDFNALSTELNRISETRAQPALRTLGVNVSISFLAAGQIDDASGAVPVLRLAPIHVERHP